MGNVSLGVELLLGVDIALDLAIADSLHYRGHARKEVVLLLFSLYTLVQVLGYDRLDTFEKSLLGALGDLVSHEDSQLVQLLPLTIESQESADLKVSRGY